MATITDATVRAGEANELLPADCFGNNAAIQCPSCSSFPILLIARPDQRGSSPGNPGICRQCGCHVHITEDTAQEELNSLSVTQTGGDQPVEATPRRSLSLATLGQIAASGSALIAAAALVWNVFVFREAQDDKSASDASAVYRDHLTLAIQNPELTTRGHTGPVDSQYEWFGSHALHTAEAIFYEVDGDPSWLRTIEWLLDRHHFYLCFGTSRQDYGIEFTEFVDEYHIQNPCPVVK